MNFLNDTEQESTLISPTSSARTSLTRDEVDRQRTKADTVTWFTDNEFIWRSGASIVWFLFLLPLLVLVYITVGSFSLWHPITWATDVISSIISVWYISKYVITLGIILMPVVLMNINLCSVEVRFGLTRIDAISSFFTLNHLSHLLLCMLIGSVATWWVSSLTYKEYGVLAQNCSSSYVGESVTLCLNETSLFLLVFGAILGICYAILFFKEKHNHIKFPIVHQERIFRLKGCLVPCFWQALVICIKSLKVCYPLYFLFGCFARNITRVVTGLGRDSESTPLDSIYGLLSIRLFWFCFVTGTFVAYTWILANRLFSIFQTEVLRFPIQAALVNHFDQSLPVVLKCQTIPLLKYLAFNDLWQLSQFSAKRRKQIFSLSIPGGRPVNWLWVSEECLTLLNDLKERLRFNNHRKHASSPRRQKTDVSQATPPETLKDQNSMTRTPSSSSSSSLFRRLIGTTRNQSQSHTSKNNAAEPNKFIEKARRLPVVRFFLEETEEFEMEELFYDAQLQIWAAEGLSRLVAASFTEDVFGVVQKILPFILSSLLELLQAVEMYLKKPLNQQHLYRCRHPSDMKKTVFVLRDSLRCSIYRITETFREHLSDIELSTGNKEFLKLFYKFEE